MKTEITINKNNNNILSSLIKFIEKLEKNSERFLFFHRLHKLNKFCIVDKYRK